MNSSTDTLIRERLIAFLQGLNVGLNGELKSDTSLIRSGLFDSAAILNLAEWIQKEVGPGVNLLQFDLSKEWETIADIERFIHRQRGSQPS